jgi:hypothetical protein
MEGTSLAYSFEDAKAKERHTTQYFEISGNRAIYHDGWLARVIHKAPLGGQAPRPADRGCVGALRRARRLQPGQRPGRQGAGHIPKVTVEVR